MLLRADLVMLVLLGLSRCHGFTYAAATRSVTAIATRQPPTPLLLAQEQPRQPTLAEWVPHVLTSDAVVPAAALFAVSVALKAMLLHLGISFPSNVIGMLGMFGLLIAVDSASPRAASSVERFFEPACRLFRTWLAAIFAPGFIVLPLSMPSLKATELATFLLLLALGTVSSTATNARVAEWLAPKGCVVDGVSATAQDPQCSTSAAPPATMPPPAATGASLSFPRAQQIALLAGSVGFGVAYLIGGVSCATLLTPCLLCTTLASFSLSSTLCPPRVQLFIHPFVATSGLALLACQLLGAISGLGGHAVLQSYASPRGAGGLLGAMMGPTVLSFAFQLFRFRVQLRERLTQLLGTALLGSMVNMLTAGLVSRALHLAPPLRVALISRNILSPLALETSKLVGGEPGLGMLAAFVSGLLGGVSGGKATLKRLRISDPVVRGLALAGTAHGGGVLALSDEPDAFPFAALMMSLCGACTVALLSIRPVRSLVLTTALGSASIP